MMQLEHYSQHPHDPLYFYGGEFSNFVGGPFLIASVQTWDGDPHEIVESYETVEHFFQASKAVSRISHFTIRAPKSAWKCKALGNSCVLRPDWEEVKYDVMMEGLRVKFAQPYFRDFLLATGHRYIAEDSPTDTIWGIRDANGGLGGKNLLGKALMELRTEIRVARAGIDLAPRAA